MATTSAPESIYDTTEHSDSDYGSDFDDHALRDVVAKAQSPPPDIVLTSIDQDPVTEHAILTLRSSGQQEQQTEASKASIDLVVIAFSAKVEHSPSDEWSFTSVNANHPTKQEASKAPESVVDENQSPLERFRTHPKKPLSVTDIVSPAWCEQQYLYSLSKHGRVRRTPAMKQGSKIHKVLEEQVHTTVRIEVKSREDMFGLKLWNVIQGLRTLRATGITRELEVWGLLDGQVVNGIIDQITTECPDQTLQAKIVSRESSKLQDRKQGKHILESNQRTLAGFVMTAQGDRISADDSKRHSSTLYLVDVKTRQSRTLPANDGRLRPTQMQLMLYHLLLSSLAADKVDKEAIFRRYGLHGDVIFSDVFIAEISKLDMNAYLDYSSRTAQSSQQDSVAELLAHNSLDALWQHMVAELQETIPEAALSPILAAEFRTADTGTLLGKRSFELDSSRLDEYVADELNWWKGARPTKGVDIEEAFKCRICEFAENCSWRKTKIEEAIQQTRQRKASRETTIANG